MAANLPFGTEYYLRPNKAADLADQIMWQFLAALALNARHEQQQVLVGAVRDKVHENLFGASQRGWVLDEAAQAMKIANVNLFLHALGLDSSQVQI